MQLFYLPHVFPVSGLRSEVSGLRSQVFKFPLSGVGGSVGVSPLLQPCLTGNSRLPQQPDQQVSSNFGSVWIWKDQPCRTSNHELMAPPRKWSFESEGSEPLDELTAGNWDQPGHQSVIGCGSSILVPSMGGIGIPLAMLKNNQSSRA
jgi:hypothetical protein